MGMEEDLRRVERLRPTGYGMSVLRSPRWGRIQKGGDDPAELLAGFLAGIFNPIADPGLSFQDGFERG